MNNAHVTNVTVFDDWAGVDRRAAIARIPRMRSQRRVLIGGIKASQIWMNDVSSADSRSVKAWLSGRGDGRVTMWQLKSLLGQFRKDLNQGEEFSPPAVDLASKITAALKRAIAYCRPLASATAQ